MKDDLMTIVALIVRQMSEEYHGGPSGRSIMDGLLDEGFDPVDIDDALSWFESLAGAGEDLGGVELWDGFKGLRVQSAAEREVLTPEAFSYLTKLNRAGIIDDRLRETVLDKILELSIPAFGTEQIKALLCLVLYSKGAAGTDDVFQILSEHGPDILNN